MKTNKIIFYAAILLSAIFILALAPITQFQEYHQFAEQRIIGHIPHFGDVLSNLSFVIVGVLLLVESKQWNYVELYKGQKTLFKALAYSSIALGLGSGYYHWAPVDYTLAWDRATMVLGFAIIFYDSCVRYDIFGKKEVIKGAVIATIAFLGTVIFWMISSRLEPYVFVQFFTMFVLVVLAIKNYKEVPSKHLFNMFVWYLVAKVFETFDKQIFMMTGELMSGHTLKHIAYAMALYAFGKDMLKRLDSNNG
jgi:hypothetical protein